MLVCYVCCSELCSIAGLRSHLRRHVGLGELVYPVKCCQGTCKSSFRRVFNFIRHLYSYHKGDENRTGNLPGILSSAPSPIGVDDDFSNDSLLQPFHSAGDRTVLATLQSEGADMVAALRANSSIPYSVIPGIIESINSMIGTTVDCVQSETMKLLRGMDVGGNVLTDVEASLKRQSDTLNEPLGFLSTRYKQDKHFDTHPLAVKPETVILGQRYETRNGVIKSVYDSYQYVSVEATLRSLLVNPQYVSMLLRDKYTPGLVSDCWDGLLCKRHPVLGDASKFSIAIQLFYDGMGTTNPLRGQSSMYNVGVFYFVVKNLPNVLNSCFSNVHLVSLCYATDLKTYGYDAVLNKFVTEMRQLSVEGFVGDFPILGTCTIHVCLLQVACDNLALNGLLGFVESFSVDYFCTMCYATQADIQHKFHESDFELRSVAKYSEDVACVATSNSLIHSRGIKRDCMLNQIPGFHATQNFSLDIMHIVLEGIIPVELSCIIFYLCNTHHAVTLAQISARIHTFWSVINVEKCNKPPELNHIDKPGRLYPSMKAVQSWALLKYLPLLIGDMVSNSDPHWLFLLHLSELVDMLFSPVFTEGMITYMRELIADHLAMFSELYGGDDENGIRLKPKHHLLVHLPTVIVESGPLVGMNCLRYELKNSFFKRSSHIVCNFTNICQTLAYRHQQNSLFSKLSNFSIRNIIVVGRSSHDSVGDYECADVLCSHFGVEMTDDVCFAKRVETASIVYTVGHHVVMGIEEEPVFAKIELFVCLPSSDEWFIVVSCMRTVTFHSHYHSYAVEYIYPKVFKVITFDSLADFRTVCCYKTVIEQKTQHFVRLPYHIITAR